MWTCKQCGLSVMFQAADPAIDEQGFHFLCIGCGARNALVRVGQTHRSEDEPLYLAQADD